MQDTFLEKFTLALGDGNDRFPGAEVLSEDVWPYFAVSPDDAPGRN